MVLIEICLSLPPSGDLDFHSLGLGALLMDGSGEKRYTICKSQFQ